MTARRSPVERAADRVLGACQGIDDDRALRAALVEEIRRHVDFDVYVWLLTDPETEVGSAPLANAPVPADLPQLIRAKYLTSTNRWTVLDNPVASLVDSTGGERDQSLAWREVLSSYGVQDVASVVFRDQHGCWGWLDLWRPDGTPPFSATDRAYLGAVTSPVTEALRRCQARSFDEFVPPLERAGPAVLVMSPSLQVKAQTPETAAYLRALIPPGDDQPPIPAAAYNVAAQMLAVEAGVDHHRPSARVHLTSGLWMTLRAARVETTDLGLERDIAVTIEPATASERRAIFTRSHALSPRETAVVNQLAQGVDTRTLARELFVSEHTVQDHLKSIFAKTGAHNRRTLLSRIAGG